MNIADLCVRRPVFATMFVGVLVVLGIFSYARLGVDLFPKVDVPTVMVLTKLEGAAPEEMESRVTKPLDLPPQNPYAKRVKCRNLRSDLELLPQYSCRSFLHFASGFVGKRNGQNPLRPHAVADQVGNAIRDDARFSRPRSGQYQERPAERLDGVTLG